MDVLKSSMVIEGFRSSRPILVDRLRDAVGFVGKLLNLGFFHCFLNLVLSLLLASLVPISFYSTPRLVCAIALLIVFTA